jgi:hypothetical protein
MPKTKKPPKTAKPDSRATFDALKRLLTRHGAKLGVAKNKPSDYWAVVRGVEFRGKPLFFGGVREGKNYVSFHLLPVYAFPELLRSLSPALKKRMQGKACFNFTAPDPALFRELAELTDAGLERFSSPEWLAAMERKGWN